jgi:hypothetical protein
VRARSRRVTALADFMAHAMNRVTQSFECFDSEASGGVECQF